MTDLERLWDDLPVGPAPTAAILREGRVRRRRGLRRPVGTLVGLGALGAAFLTGVHVAGPPDVPGGGPGGPTADLPTGEASFHGELVAAGSCEALLEHYVTRGQDLVGPFGWKQPRMLFGMGAEFPVDLQGTARDVRQAYTAKVDRATGSDTGTNVQESGVDEPDVAKTDGEVLYRISGSVLRSYDVTGEEVAPLGEVALPGAGDGEILLVADTVVALQQRGLRGDAGGRVFTVDVGSPAAMEVVEQVDLDSPVVAARQHGDVVRLVLSTGLPELVFLEPGRRSGLTRSEAARANRQVVADTTIADWLPRAARDGGAEEQLSDCADVAIPRAELPLGTTTVAGFAAGEPEGWDVTAVAADASTTYSSTDHLYLASAAVDPWGWCGPGARCAWGGSTGQGTTHLFDLELTGTGTRYAGAGQVDGAVRDRWAMDEVDGVLRLALSPTTETDAASSVVTMRRRGDELVEVGRLDGIAPREDITSVRWFDDLAIVVTFRQVDPLFTIDLTDPAAPRLLGELKVPGFSAYLHPLGERRLLGIGEGPQRREDGRRTWGAQAGLFKVTDLTDVRRLDTVDYGSATRAGAATDPRQLTWLPERRTVLTVVQRGHTGFVSVLTLDEGELGNRMVEAERGADVDALRIVPLPDGRVVLVSDSDASFLALEE
ncbi:beta-propeller domain-containing protein [Nocardioides sp. SYSU DS0663]|uniref:beta-propeller domain-containing protein n=1 Tax=Nocardioides sp. SYSU DS0663 TaxID=3416445 RepID=UPI003F4B7761